MGRAPSTGPLVALVLLLGACTTANPLATPSPTPSRDPNALNVTALLDLSGSRTPNGGPQRDALQLWADQHSSGTPRVRLKITDVAGSPSKTALELRREVVEARADAIIVGVSVDYDEPFANLVQLAQVPVLFTLPIPEPAIRDGGFAFALAPTPVQLARAVLADAAQRSVLSSALVVSDESTSAIVERVALTGELARRGASAGFITLGAGDHTPEIRSVLARATFAYFAGTPRSYIDGVRTATSSSAPYLSYLCELGEIADLRDAAALVSWPGSRWIAASSTGTSNAARTSFVQAYTDRAGPPTSVAASAYDALALLSTSAADGIDPVRVRDHLQSGTFTGIATTYAFSRSQHAGFDPSDLVLLRYVAQRVPPAVR